MGKSPPGSCWAVVSTEQGQGGHHQGHPPGHQVVQSGREERAVITYQWERPQTHSPDGLHAVPQIKGWNTLWRERIQNLLITRPHPQPHTPTTTFLLILPHSLPCASLNTDEDRPACLGTGEESISLRPSPRHAHRVCWCSSGGHDSVSLPGRLRSRHSG